MYDIDMRKDFVMASVISVRVSDEEKEAFEKFAKVHGTPVSTMMKEITIQHLEDEYDMKIVEQFEKDLAAGKESLTPLDDVINELGLDV